jgi:hypothetical protein
MFISAMGGGKMELPVSKKCGILILLRWIRGSFFQKHKVCVWEVIEGGKKVTAFKTLSSVQILGLGAV